VKTLIEIMADTSNLLIACAHKIAVEDVAMEVSDEADTEECRAIHGGREVEWFNVHHLRGKNVPYNLWHESVLYNLACFIADRTGQRHPDEQFFEDIILSDADVFLLCGTESWQRQVALDAAAVSA
jgi:hypothetical protein